MNEEKLRLAGMENVPHRSQIMDSRALGMLIFVFTEIMLFAGFISAFTIVRSAAMAWPPPGQPRLPMEETAINTAALLASGVALAIAHQVYKRNRSQARWPLLAAISLGAIFVVFQGVEWVGMLRAGLTLTSSVLGSFFYMIIGLHALHAVVALTMLVRACLLLNQDRLQPGLFLATQIFWYFVVGVWPFIYLRVYP
ncbi:MAG: heme-copper oxidase subunit III [Deltaproteobacteria bacterium]|nr:heme-copper oxidase subunit III [Deltaproteobacteria bacterium]MBW2665834.1 heme-copper oxidase subunit III [Deltaproteobacteria bacterium]